MPQTNSTANMLFTMVWLLWYK